MPVLEIADGFHATAADITSVNLPVNLKTIRAIAFIGCMELTTVTIPASLQNVRFPPVAESTDISAGSPENNAFQFCQKLPIKTRQAIQNLGYKDEF